MSSRPEPADVADTLKAFGLDIDRIERVANRTLCTLFRAFMKNKSLGIKCYPGLLPLSAVESEVALVDHLALHVGRRVPCFRILCGGRKVVGMKDSHHLVAYDWIDGNVCLSCGEAALFKMVGLMNDLHRAAALAPRIERSDEWLWEDMRTLLVHEPFPESLRTRLDASARAGRPWSTRQPDLILCHGDFTLANIVWRGEQCAAIDFSNSIRAPREWDAAVLVADLILDAAYDSKPDRIPVVVEDAYGDGLDRSTLDRLLATALPQRAVFKCYAAGAAERTQITGRLLSAWA